MNNHVPKVVIVWAGFGGLTVAQSLARLQVEVTVIDRHNFHYFQPLLYQVATAALSPADFAWPIRGTLKRQKNTTVLMANVTGVDIRQRPAGREPVPVRRAARPLADLREVAVDELGRRPGPRVARVGLVGPDLRAVVLAGEGLDLFLGEGGRAAR
jgi:NADPH-dependent 2,4-dienoyl-CoA reductase/sulfur reductase-like enzyme